ncbi:hypothetical protein L3Q82_020262 [Scortum barcoo]|uniref:Uncharacterized protein n=1 Tax=Scortum barcoo TaxID=214431 RepID=A0ACB8VB62_9TELE|nr:hypothetical protein L3Q82_020262 [Scortum barcoo]
MRVFMKMAAFGTTLLTLATLALHMARCQGSMGKGKDSSPLRFTHHLYNSTINENSAPRTYIETPVKMGIEVTDPFWEIKYNIVSGDDAGLFEAEAVKIGDFCFLRIKTRSSNSALLNREVRDSYTLTVEATEDTFDFQAKTKVFVQVLDTNDLKPLFLPASYDVTIREDARLQSSVVRVSATDADIGSNAEFYYTFTSRAHPFVVDPFTGTVSLVKKANHTRTERYDLTVLAEDRTKKISGVHKFGNVARVTVNVLKTSMGSPVITPPAKPTVSTDGKITINVHVEAGVKPVESLNIVGGDPLKCFEIIPLGVQGSDFQVISTKRIIWSQTPFGLNLSLQAKDRSFPSLLSPITQIHVPAFHYSPLAFLEDTYIVTLSEFSPPKTHVVKVSVTSVPYNVTFSIKNNPDTTKFKINPKTGIIITTEKFDYEQKNRYEFDVVANHGEAETHIVVEVTDENDNSPQFTYSSYQATLDENTPVGSSVLKVAAIDEDKGKNGFVTYSIANSAPLPFTVDPFTGVISTSEHLDYELMKRRYHLRVWASDSGSPYSQLVCPLDRESKEFYILNITVYDLGTPQTSAWKFVAVNVMDVNDNAPVFDQPRYVIHVPENTELDSIIFTARAVDLDVDANGNVQYSLLTSTDMFRIDELTGEVTVTGRLDREISPRHDLWIEARDQSKLGSQLFSTIDLVVVLQDINDNPPKFAPKVYKIKVPEDVPVGTLLVWVESVDLDLGSGGLVTYNLKNAEGGIFNLDSSTGALTLERELDFERRPIYNLTVRAVDHGLPRSLSSSCFVEIQVLDVNENLHRPVFTEFVYEAGVMEDAAVGTSVVMLTASDKDLGRDGVVRYHIHEGSGLGVFTIDEETGVIRTTDSLDREMMPYYWLSVYVTDLGTEPLISWTHVFLEVLDINDNAPELSQPVYFASVQENVDKVKSVVQVSATDADTSSDGKLSFQMLESHRTYFDVDPKTGVISTHSALDREDKPEHSVEVIVSDNGSPSLLSTATVVIRVLDANDNRPKFTDKLFHVKVLEQRHQAGKQEVCRMVARDDDEGPNAVVTYKLQDNKDERFEIDSVTGMVTSHGDFWPGNYSILTIKATDQGSPSRSSTARLDIEWITRPSPSAEPITFDEPHFTFAVMETEPVTHMVGIIMTETHRQRWFDITGGDEEKDFDIQRNTGTISIARRLNAARHSNYNMTVRVTDGYHNATTQAYIRVLDMNEHRPVFLKPLYTVRVPEDTSPWKDILQISAQDADTNSKLVYSIHSSLHPNSTKFFHLDPKSGVLVMTEELDYEMISVHTLIVMVRDQEIPVKRNFVKVVVHVEDCNDHSPAFLSPRYEASISNMAPTGSEVVLVKALDKDMGSNADISYSLHSGNIDNIFSIDPELGSISVSKPLDLQPQDQFHLTVKATDQGFPQRSDLCSVHVHVRISEHTPPAFPSDEYLTEISELSSLGAPVVTVSASSPSAVHYGIESGNPNGTFHINPYTGLISVQKHLDFENCASYKLRVTASTTAGALSKTLVYIYVIDENDNAPVFQKIEYLGQISESAHINSMVMGERNTPLVIQASDADRDANSLLVYQILEPEALNVFKIDSSMGTISLISPVDFEAKPEYHLTVQVKDSGEPSLYAAEPAKVTVRVLDLNDCPPHFTSPVYESSIIFPAVRDTEVVHVTAHDADSAVSYSITEGNLHNVFSIHPNTGVITVNDVFEFSPFYQLVVRASDGLYKDSAAVMVNVTNITASSLGFEQKVYSASVAENLKTVKTLAALKATGCYLNEPVLYSVINPMGKFSISQTSGVLETTGIPFDREEQDIYEVVVKVQDMRTPARTATTQVKVFIDDVNDNPPQFLNLPFSMMISEASEPGDVLYQATAIDRDLGENGSIMYSLEEDFSLFRIDPDVGDVSLQRPLDFEALNKYVLTVLAIDEGEPSQTTMAQLSIQVRNQTNPVFQTLLYPLKVPENVPPFTTILHVQARNPEGYRLIYNLEEENASKHFHIDFKTGVLTVTNPLDYESQTMHMLTVRATDSVTGAFSEASIEIEVEDVNDNTPVFSQLRYTVNIAEGLEIGTSVIHLSASDRDSGRNKDLTFEIVQTEGNETDFFEIDAQSGLIVTKQILDHEDTKQFNLKITATDNGTVPLSGEAYVLVNVTDVNDNPPDFVSSEYEATLDEMAKCGHIVIKIQASDPDTGDLNNLKYKILSGNEGRYFNINESSGIISFSNVCKRNLDPYYNLTVGGV